MNLKISKGIYVWCQFDKSSVEAITCLQSQTNKILLGPKFDPHLTLTGPIPFKEELHSNMFEELASDTQQFQIKLNGIGYKNEFFQSFFLNVLESKNLKSIRLSIEKIFGFASKEYFPHVSLFYGNADLNLKENLAKKLFIPNEVLVNKISLVRINQSIGGWNIYKTFKLKKNSLPSF